MKKLIYFSIALTGLLITSCASNNKDEDTITPSTDAREKYVAYWNVSEYSAVVNGTSTHTVNIIKSPSNSSEIIINNFSGLSVSARASVSNNNLTIPYQQIGSIGFTQGSGTFNGSNSIAFTYTTTISTSRDSCTATYTK
jgi:hypothetical protein